MKSVSSETMRRLETLAINHYGISEDLLMEEAGSNIADIIRDRFSSDIKIGIICGKGKNGGIGYVISRKLLSWGFNIQYHTPFSDDNIDNLSLKKLRTIRRIDEKSEMKDFPTANVYIEALTGYRYESISNEAIKECVERIKNWSAETFSVGAPCGINPDTGKPGDIYMSPNYTAVLGLPLKGLRPENAGEIKVIDTGIPIKAAKEMGIDTSKLFLEKSVIDISDIKKN